MENVQLRVETRQTKGKERAAQMRRAGKVPGVFYGTGRAATSLSVDAKEFRIQLSKIQGAPLLKLASSAPELNDKLVLLKEIQCHPVTSAFLHADFFEVDESKPLQTAIPIHISGRAKGVTAGGTLQTLVREIAIECLPRDLPPAVEIDVTELDINDVVRIEDLNLPQQVRILIDPHTALITVQARRLPEVTEEETTEQEAAATTEETPDTDAPAEASE
jgi:large subunit ribosomal protein L25